MKELLLNVNPDPGQLSRLEVAVSLAKSQSAHITCLQSFAVPVGIGDTPVVPVDVAEMLEKRAAEFQEEIEVRLDQAEVGWTWVRQFGDAAALAVSYSRLSDAVVLSTAETYPSVGAVALHAQTPVLAVPEAAQAFNAEAPVLIAWNGSTAAANAMRGALPLMVVAPSVHILTVDRDDEEFPAARAFEYLTHHAIRSEIHWRHSDGKPPAQAITAFAQQMGAGVIVAGAYGHNRIREMLLGSVTRELMRTSTIPLVLAH